MGLLLILPILVCGYLVCTLHPGYFYRLHRFEGQLLYLEVAKLGLYCFAGVVVFSLSLIALSKLISSISIYGFSLPLDYLPYISEYLASNGISKKESSSVSAFFFQVGILLTFSPFIWRKVYINRCKNQLGLKNEAQIGAFLMYELLNDSPLNKILQNSLKEESLYMFTMNDRKVYVGSVISIGTPTESSGVDHEFNIVPVLSGYRDKDTLEIKFTTEYADAPEDLFIMLLQENVSSATNFNFEVWEAFKSRKDAAAAAVENSSEISIPKGSKYIVHIQT